MQGTDLGRRDDIDTLRAIACFLLVLYHVIGSTPGNGLELPVTHALTRINAALVDLRMPLFSFLSGMVFIAARPGAGPFRPWPPLATKLRRLLLPMATVGTVFWLVRAFMGYNQLPWPSIFVLPYAHFWFLQATFALMAISILGVWMTGGRDRAVICVIGVAGALAYVAPLRPDLNIFSVVMACKLAPFFATGYLIARAALWRRTADHGLRRAAVVGLALTIGGGAALSEGMIDPGPILHRALGLGLGLAFCILLVVARPSQTHLARIGRHSYPVYLFHVFFTAGTIAGLAMAVPDLPVGAVAPIALAAGIFGPIGLGLVLLRVPILATLFLGLRLSGRKLQPAPGPTAPPAGPAYGTQGAR